MKSKKGNSLCKFKFPLTKRRRVKPELNLVTIPIDLLKIIAYNLNCKDCANLAITCKYLAKILLDTEFRFRWLRELIHNGIVLKSVVMNTTILLGLDKNSEVLNVLNGVEVVNTTIGYTYISNDIVKVTNEIEVIRHKESNPKSIKFKVNMKCPYLDFLNLTMEGFIDTFSHSGGRCDRIFHRGGSRRERSYDTAENLFFIFKKASGNVAIDTCYIRIESLARLK